MRKTISAPSGVLDGVKIYEGTEETFTDLNLEGGREYFYAVFTLDHVPNYSERVTAKGTALVAGAAIPAILSSQSSAFTKNLSLGLADEEVKNLQILLNKLGFQIAQSGIGSSGNETNYFGNLTKQAVIKFQNYYRAEILTPAGLTEGTGYVGSATRAKLNALAGSGGTALILSSSPAISTSSKIQSSAFTKNLSLGLADEEVKNLQILLNKLGFQIAQSGIGSSGNETNYFGNLTKQAVIKFQNYYRAEILTPAGLTEGTGYVGSATRAKLNMLVGKPMSVVIETVDLTSIRNVLAKSAADFTINDFKELVFKKGEKEINLSEFLPALLGQLNPALETFFEESFTAFVWVDNKGTWPGYILKLKPAISFNDVQNQFLQWEKTVKFENIFIKSPGAIRQSFTNGQINSVKTRYQLYIQPGAEFNYGWKDNFLIISSSYGGFLEALTKL